MWQKGCALFVGLMAVLAYGWVSAQEPSDGGILGASYILKAGDCVNWPGGHAWYLRMSSTSNYPLKIVTTNSSGRAIYAKAPSKGYAVYANGRIAAKSLKYTTARKHVLTVPAEAFTPTQSTFYTIDGVASILVNGSGNMAAPVMLPDGAVITKFKVNFLDDAVPDVTTSLQLHANTGLGLTTMAVLDSSGVVHEGSKQTTSILFPSVNNAFWSYRVLAASTNWSSGLVGVISVNLEYTISEAW
jgi:hypothetical protein